MSEGKNSTTGPEDEYVVDEGGTNYSGATNPGLGAEDSVEQLGSVNATREFAERLAAAVLVKPLQKDEEPDGDGIVVHGDAADGDDDISS